jgi:dCTP deaminase
MESADYLKVNGALHALAYQYQQAGAVLSDEMIANFVEIKPKAFGSPEGAISYGLTAYGYDMRIDRKYKIFTNLYSAIVDPKNFDPTCFVDFEGDECIIPPNSFALGVSVEHFRIPRDVLAICVGKSTYARCGIVVNVTPLEPEWQGKVTIEISNTTPNPAKIYSNEGIAQVIFFKSLSPCKISYADKKGRYQDQQDLTLPFVK